MTKSRRKVDGVTIVFLCVGAAKAGTSWLYRQLSQHPACHLRTIKELHYFDGLDDGSFHRQIEQMRGRQSELMLRTGGGANASPWQAARIRDGADWLTVLEGGADINAYLAYLTKGASSDHLVGEATPAYALLPVECLARMARMTPDVRMLYLVRDPVERLWSHVRMIAARRDERGRVEARRCDNILGRVFSGEETQIERRGDYAGAFRRLTAAVPGGKLMIEVFEDMVSGHGFGRICDFLGIARLASSPVPVHEGQALPMSSEQRRRAMKWLAPQYDAAYQVLGQIPGTWGREV